MGRTLGSGPDTEPLHYKRGSGRVRLRISGVLQRGSGRPRGRPRLVIIISRRGLGGVLRIVRSEAPPIGVPLVVGPTRRASLRKLFFPVRQKGTFRDIPGAGGLGIPPAVFFLA